MDTAYLPNSCLTTNQDYGSFYSGRRQRGRVSPSALACELAVNNLVRHERRQLPSIGYDIMFDRYNSFQIVARDRRKFKPIITRQQLKYLKFDRSLNEARSVVLEKAQQLYSTFIQCIYKDKPEKNVGEPKLSDAVINLLANELHTLNGDLSADELAEYMLAITVPHQYMGMSTIQTDQPYPGTERDCAKTPQLQHLLQEFETAQQMLAESKKRFDQHSIQSQPTHGLRYIYNPFTNSMSLRAT